jgi:hypothetical protein
MGAADGMGLENGIFWIIPTNPVLQFNYLDPVYPLSSYEEISHTKKYILN